jgi:hypothetical protein
VRTQIIRRSLPVESGHRFAADLRQRVLIGARIYPDLAGGLRFALCPLQLCAGTLIPARDSGATGLSWQARFRMNERKSLYACSSPGHWKVVWRCGFID